MEQRVYLRALEPDDYKTSINWRRNDLIWSQLGGVNIMYQRVMKRNG